MGNKGTGAYKYYSKNFHYIMPGLVSETLACFLTAHVRVKDYAQINNTGTYYYTFYMQHSKVGIFERLSIYLFIHQS